MEDTPGERIKATVSDLTEHTVSQNSPVYLVISWESNPKGRRVNTSPLSTCVTYFRGDIKQPTFENTVTRPQVGMVLLLESVPQFSCRWWIPVAELEMRRMLSCHRVAVAALQLMAPVSALL